MNVDIVIAIGHWMENGTYQVAKDIAMTPRSQDIAGSHIANVRFYAQSRKTDREVGIRALHSHPRGLTLRVAHVGVSQPYFNGFALGRRSWTLDFHGRDRSCALYGGDWNFVAYGRP
jgi:hypothetical protein